MPRKRYIYHVVRYHPRAWDGEQVNIGVIVGNDEEGFQAKATTSERKCRCICHNLDLWENPNYRDSVLLYPFQVVEESGLSEEGLRRIYESTGNAMSCVQISPQSITLGYNLAAELESIYEMFVRD